MYRFGIEICLPLNDSYVQIVFRTGKAGYNDLQCRLVDALIRLRVKLLFLVVAQMGIDAGDQIHRFNGFDCIVICASF